MTFRTCRCGLIHSSEKSNPYFNLYAKQININSRCQNNIVIISGVGTWKSNNAKCRRYGSSTKIFFPISISWHLILCYFHARKENIRIMCSRRNYLLKVFPAGGSFPLLNIHPSESLCRRWKFLRLWEENGENGKYCASYYLFTYLHFSLFLRAFHSE